VNPPVGGGGSPPSPPSLPPPPPPIEHPRLHLRHVTPYTTDDAGASGRPGADMSGHTSLLHVGRAYEQLVPLVGRDRIIVIAQLQESVEWLERCTQSVEECRRMTGLTRNTDSLFAHNVQRLQQVREECACLIADGGADYDGEVRVNSTLVNCFTLPRVACALLSYFPTHDGCLALQWFRR
jgi:hypothetical protein